MDLGILDEVLFPDLRVAKSVSLDGSLFSDRIEVLPGDRVFFRVQITNTGEVDLDPVEIVDCTNEPGLVDCDDITGYVTRLHPGEQITLFYPCEIASDAPWGVEFGDTCTVIGHPMEVPNHVEDCDVMDSDSAFVYIKPKFAARMGNVNAGDGELEDVLFINGSVGDRRRIISVSPGTSVRLDMNRPSAGPNPAGFTVYLIKYEPNITDMTVQPYNIGIACMAMPLSNGVAAPPPITVANSIGFYSRLGYPALPGIPKAPCNIFNYGPGLPGGTYTFQGYIFDHGSGGKGISLTNAIVLKVQ
jgi:hypothetical protein